MSEGFGAPAAQTTLAMLATTTDAPGGVLASAAVFSPQRQGVFRAFVVPGIERRSVLFPFSTVTPAASDGGGVRDGGQRASRVKRAPPDQLARDQALRCVVASGVVSWKQLARAMAADSRRR